MSAVLKGDMLFKFLLLEINHLRATAGVVAKAALRTSKSAHGAMRYLGQHLDPIAQAAATYIKDAESSGALSGLGFSAQGFLDALSDVNDKQAVAALLALLAEDAHATAIHARAELAVMTGKLVKSHRFLKYSPGTADPVRAQDAQASDLLETRLQALLDDRKKRRQKGDALRSTTAALHSVQQQNQQHQSAADALEAQKDLRLKLLSGEPLRPEDVVVQG